METVSRKGIFILILVVYNIPGNQGWVNQYDKPFEFQCPNGQAISKIESVHDNRHEDRIFDFGCRITGGTHTLCHWTSYVNSFDEFFSYQCNNHGFITGFQSYQDNGAEDRRWKFHCCEEQEMDTSECYYTNPNPFDAPFNVAIPENKILRGVTSVHDNRHEDREYIWEICSLINRHEYLNTLG